MEIDFITGSTKKCLAAMVLPMMAAMFLNMILANLAGYFIPVILEKLHVDPALASGVFVTTVTDVMGFFMFLGLATLVLPYII